MTGVANMAIGRVIQVKLSGNDTVGQVPWSNGMTDKSHSNGSMMKKGSMGNGKTNEALGVQTLMEEITRVVCASIHGKLY